MKSIKELVSRFLGVPYYPSTPETPVLQLSLSNMAVNAAENFSILDNATVLLPQGKADFIGLTAGQAFSFPPSGALVSGVYSIVIVATSIPPQISFPQAQMDFAIGYTDNAGVEYNDAALTMSDNLQPATISEAVLALSPLDITIFSSFVTFGVAGALPANVWNTQAVMVGGPGVAAYGATLHQATSLATAFFYGTNIILGGAAPPVTIYTVLTGVDDGSSVWTDPVSGQTLTPNGASAGYFTGPGFGVAMTQFVTSAFGPEMNVPTTEMYLGPHVSGIPDLPSGHISIAGPAPSLTHAYAWYDPVNGGVFVPTATWTDAATRITFPYNAHYRVILVG